MLKRFNNFKKLAADILRLQDSDNDLLFSFDVFDTIVHRRVAPNAIIETIGRELCTELHARGLNISRDVMKARSDAYLEAAETLVAQGLDTDAHLDDLALPWVRILAGGPFDGDASVAAETVEREIALEIETIFPNPVMLSLLSELKLRGARVVLTSDMYLGKKYVTKILSANGFDGLYDDIFVSADTGKLKRTGRMFGHVLELTGVTPEKCIHIGDNFISDGVMAQRAGVRALVIRDKVLSSRFDRLEYDYSRQKHDRAWKGVCAAAYAQAAPGVVGTPEEAYGLKVLGPILVPFAHAVAARCHDYGITKAFFFAREGLLLKQLFDAVAPLISGAQSQTESHYLGVSRLSTFVAAMDGARYGLREISSALANTGHFSLRNLVQPLRIPKAKLSEMACSVGITDVDAPLPPNFLSWPPLAAFLRNSDFMAVVETQAEKGRFNLVSYLRGVGFFATDRVAVVDVGWGAQIQENLAVALENLADRPQIMGLYLGLNNIAHLRKTNASWVDWTLCDQGHAEWYGWAALEFVFLFEVMTRAPHGTVVGYSDDGNGVRPITKGDSEESRQTEAKSDPAIANVQLGILDYAQHYKTAARIFEIKPEDMMPYARSTVARAVRFPTRSEAAWISRAKNVSDLGSSEVVAFSDGPLRLTRPRQTVNLLSRSFWPYALVRQKLGLVGQFVVAVIRGVRMLPPSDQQLAPWIVWHEPSPRKSVLQPTATTCIRNELEELGSSNMRKMQDAGRRESRRVLLHQLSAPLSLADMIPLNICYRAVRVIARLKKRHVPAASCISVRGLIMRENHWNRMIKISRSIKRRVQRLYIFKG
ncbi:HAD-IA family hydrolase [Agrobacterium sp. MS2]|uniref:HAD-IA family hydrolase n=1 Tax=Agrobacterium sp. MS2 TaxID=1345498 RepID=UPI00187803E6|nr:HAD-IA family hydrolase [Agrobacterium sp. MS2]